MNLKLQVIQGEPSLITGSMAEEDGIFNFYLRLPYPYKCKQHPFIKGGQMLYKYTTGRPMLY